MEKLILTTEMTGIFLLTLFIVSVLSSFSLAYLKHLTKKSNENTNQSNDFFSKEMAIRYLVSLITLMLIGTAYIFSFIGIYNIYYVWFLDDTEGIKLTFAMILTGSKGFNKLLNGMLSDVIEGKTTVVEKVNKRNPYNNFVTGLLKAKGLPPFQKDKSSDEDNESEDKKSDNA